MSIVVDTPTSPVKMECKILHPGAIHGRSRIVNAERICDTPSERWRHGSAMLDARTMIVAGGFSRECEDYGDDLWEFDLVTHAWKEIYSPKCPLDYEGPGKRWRFTMLGGLANPFNGEASVLLFA